jgi:hypothetical protein
MRYGYTYRTQINTLFSVHRRLFSVFFALSYKVNFQHLFLALPRDGKSGMEVGDELLSFILNLP